MYAVTGVSGQTGAVVARALLAQSLPVRVIVRDGQKSAPWAALGADVAVADISDVNALKAALDGIRSVYLLNPPAYAQPDPFSVAAHMSEVFVEAIETSDIEKAVVLSSISAHLSKGNGIIHTNHLIEKRMASVRKPVTYLRPGYFFENWAHVLPVARAEGILPSMISDLDMPVPMVSVNDIGATAAKLMTETWFGRRLVELVGPTNTTANGAARTISEALGRPVKAMAVPRDAWAGILTGSGMTERSVSAFVDMYDGFNDGTIRFAGALPRRGPTTMREAAVEMVDRH